MSLKRDILNTVVIRILRLFVGFGGTMVLARWLKPEGMGRLAVFLAFPLMLSGLAEMGIRQSIAYYVGKEKYGIEEIGNAVSTIWVATSAISFGIVLGVYYFQGLFEYGRQQCFLGALIVPASLILRYCNGIAMGKQSIGSINVSEACNSILRIVLIVILVAVFNLAVFGALLMNVFSILLAGLLMLYWIRKNWQLNLRLSFDGKLLASLMIHGIKYALALFVITMNYRINILILQRYVDDVEIGYFSVGVRLAELIWLIPASVGMVIFSHSTGSRDPKQFSLKVVQMMRLHFLLCGLGAVVLAVICPYFIGIVFGKEYLAAVPAIRWMLPGIVAMVIFKVLNADLAGRGRPLLALKAFIFALLINVVLNFVLVPEKGVIGSAVAVTVSYMIGAVTLLCLYSKEIGVDVKMMILGSLRWRWYD